MPEYVINVILGGFIGWLIKRVEGVEDRLRKTEIANATNQSYQQSLDRNFARLEAYLQRVEEKLDAHVSENRERIRDIKEKYHLIPKEDND